jgi:hypothetical protein
MSLNPNNLSLVGSAINASPGSILDTIQQTYVQPIDLIGGYGWT